jgi:hypothetical protein
MNPIAAICCALLRINLNDTLFICANIIVKGKCAKTWPYCHQSHL